MPPSRTTETALQAAQAAREAEARATKLTSELRSSADGLQEGLRARSSELIYVYI